MQNLDEIKGYLLSKGYVARNVDDKIELIKGDKKVIIYCKFPAILLLEGVEKHVKGLGILSLDCLEKIKKALGESI
ncbi:MAG: hypothetical protein ACP5JF_02750 [Candidatus Methanodesulfokora sp.]|jgi:hypothetical protein